MERPPRVTGPWQEREGVRTPIKFSLKQKARKNIPKPKSMDAELQTGVSEVEADDDELEKFMKEVESVTGVSFPRIRGVRLPILMLRGPLSPVSLAKCRYCYEKNVQLTPPEFRCTSCGRIPQALEFIGQVQNHPDQDGGGDGSIVMSEKEANIYFNTGLLGVPEYKAAYEERVGYEICGYPPLMDCELCGENFLHWTQLCPKRFPTMDDLMKEKNLETIKGGICAICGEEGHWIGICPFNRGRTPVKCDICMKEDHVDSICPWLYELPPGKVPPPGYKIVCTLCTAEPEEFSGSCRPRVIDRRLLALAAAVGR